MWQGDERILDFAVRITQLTGPITVQFTNSCGAPGSSSKSAMTWSAVATL